MACITHHDACECRQARVDRTVMLLADALYTRLYRAGTPNLVEVMRGYGVVRDEDYGWRIADHAAALAAKDAEVAAAVNSKDDAYHERNMLVAALARMFPSGIAKTDIPGWDPAWHGCVSIDTPEGQMSWHYHDSEAGLFTGLPPYEKTWDGHSTPEKYARLARLGNVVAAAVARENERIARIVEKDYLDDKFHTADRPNFVLTEARRRIAEKIRASRPTPGAAKEEPTP